LENIPEYLTIFTNLTRTIELINDLITRNQGKKERLLIEMEQNVSTIKLYVESGTPIDDVINNLRTEKLKEALESGFKFKRFNSAKVTRETTGDLPYYNQYIGWSTKKLFKNIYLKIAHLQDIVRIDSTNPNIRKSVRLINILKMIKLLLVHIS
jgi:hypothetical protein